ncbi:hypothetical protein FIU86_18125 [Roseovarius sp. THAF9]|uniref:hypothetical protein n=1 Tax=Roseovarius sp. THAF9 TaxID=2587847 RepID=UPI001267B0F9|nr:hypothetical protein [Roseovarius sp. THAF9]QFT94775.1 hypothetical protein FIU86_18125 [Roseovarius sp. THAF9]
MPNLTAYIVLFTFPLVVVILFKRMPLQHALVWSIVAGYLLLPLRAGFDLPVLPPVDKTLIPAGCAGLMCLIASRSDPHPFKIARGQSIFWGLIALLTVGPVITALQNGQPIIIGATYLPAIRPYDAASMVLSMLVMILPFLLGRRYLGTEEGQWILLRVLVLSILAYSPLILFESRMSPQLNQMIYGFFPHIFEMHVRGNGFRPLVFLNHGLWLAIAVATAFVSCLAMVRLSPDGKMRARWMMAAFYLFFVLLLCRSLGPLSLSLLAAPLVLLLSPRLQGLVAAVLAATVLLYPILRGSDLVPTEQVYQIAESINEERAASLQYRLDNEDLLLEKAEQKPLGGWGSWGRNFVYNQEGQNISTTDGYWIIVIGVYGWIGYLAQFGLLTLPMILLGLARIRLSLGLASSCLGVVMSINLIDQIPNATVSPIVWLIAGSMMGLYQTAPLRGTTTEQAPESAPNTDPAPPPELAYRREFTKASRRHVSSSNKTTRFENRD